MKTKSEIESRIKELTEKANIAIKEDNIEKANRLDLKVDTLMWVLED